MKINKHPNLNHKPAAPRPSNTPPPTHTSATNNLNPHLTRTHMALDTGCTIRYPIHLYGIPFMENIQNIHTRGR